MKSSSSKQSFEFNKRDTFSKMYHTSFGKYQLCNGRHVLMQCPKFIGMNIRTRNNTVRKLQVCKNCLYKHSDTQCTSIKRCKECNDPHHTLLNYSTLKTAPRLNNINMGQRSQTKDREPASSTKHQLNHFGAKLYSSRVSESTLVTYTRAHSGLRPVCRRLQ